MKNQDIYKLNSAFLVHTALLVGFMFTISLGSFAYWFPGSTLISAPTTLNSSSALSPKK
jgi:hypothetical protein